MIESSKLITYEQFLEAMNTVRQYKLQIGHTYKVVKEEINSVSRFAYVTKETIICDAGLTVRSFNTLRARTDVDTFSTIEKLSMLSIKELSRVRNVGKKTIQEIKELCFYAGVKMLP